MRRATACATGSGWTGERQALNPRGRAAIAARVRGGDGQCAHRYPLFAAAVYLARQVTVADIESDALWNSGEPALHAALRAAWSTSTPIVASDGRVQGTFAAPSASAGHPDVADHELMSRMAQIAGIAIERRRSEDALRNSEVKFRGLFEHDGGRVPTRAAAGSRSPIRPS